MTLIKLTQKPNIEYRGMQGISETIDKRIKAMNIEGQVASPDTLKALKTMRARLNKEFKEYEEQRKYIKNALLQPYQELEDQYKPLIAIKYQEADRQLKDKIYGVEDQLKQDKEDQLKRYFYELCTSKNIDFAQFKDTGLNITLSASEKSLKEQIDTFVAKLEEDLNTINILPEDDEFKAEALAEYKATKDLNHSLQVIQERRRAKEVELKRQEEIKRIKAEQQEQANIQAEKVEDTKPQVAQPLQAPTVEEEQEKAPQLLVATFTVKGTLDQLKALKAFITQNNIELL